MTCPPFTDLCAADAADALRDHLASCPRCRAIVARIAGSEPPVEPDTAPSARPASPAPRVGGVWTFWAPDAQEYVVGAILEADATELLIVPVLLETSWAAEEDMVLSTDLLGYPALAPVWAADHVLAEQAAEAVDMLSETHLAAVTCAYDAFFAGEPLPEPGGPPILGDEDPRIAAHAAIADDLRKVYAPWAMLQVAEELGPVVAHRREELGVGLEMFDVEPRDWRAFEAGMSDPAAAIPVKAMARAINALGLVASRRVLELARASVQAHHQAEGVAAASARARRRHGVTARSRRDPEAARAVADHYVEALAKEMGL
jgi:hypothetical protein